MNRRYLSFARQVQLWGFIRLSTGTEKGFYCHPNFRRGFPELVAKMVRPKKRGVSKIDKDRYNVNPRADHYTRMIESSSIDDAGRRLIRPFPDANMNLLPRPSAAPLQRYIMSNNFNNQSLSNLLPAQAFNQQSLQTIIQQPLNGDFLLNHRNLIQVQQQHQQQPQQQRNMLDSLIPTLSANQNRATCAGNLAGLNPPVAAAIQQEQQRQNQINNLFLTQSNLQQNNMLAHGNKSFITNNLSNPIHQHEPIHPQVYTGLAGSINLNQQQQRVMNPHQVQVQVNGDYITQPLLSHNLQYRVNKVHVPEAQQLHAQQPNENTDDFQLNKNQRKKEM